MIKEYRVQRTEQRAKSKENRVQKEKRRKERAQRIDEFILFCCFVFKLLLDILFVVFVLPPFCADRKEQRALRMGAFLTQNVVDVFGVSGTRLAA